jgi:hypothetical protein
MFTSGCDVEKFYVPLWRGIYQPISESILSL